MQDRELLELAAKAAGIEAAWCATGTMLLPATQSNEGCDEWNPLLDDGDALRLAVKLNLLLGPEFVHYLSLERFAHQDQDDAFATRRAIVRAAADKAQQGRFSDISATTLLQASNEAD